MFTFLATLTTVLFLLLILVAGMRPTPGVISPTELERRVKRANHEAKKALHREQFLPDVAALRRIVELLLLVTVVLLSVVTFGWLVGVIVGVLVVLLYGTIASLKPIARASQQLYDILEPSLLKFVEKVNSVFVLFRILPIHDSNRYRRFDSVEELQELIHQAGDVLSENERTLLTHGLGFKDQRVDSIMTPRSMIESIKKTEFLGPLVLSELHDGHSRLPVIGLDLDHVVGTLHLKDLLSLDVKQSVTAEKAMEAKVFYIREDQTLEHALAAFLKTRHHLFIVINKERETVGLLTLEDVIEALIGRKIYDEDDNHESAKEIAAAEANNSPKNHTDV